MRLWGSRMGKEPDAAFSRLSDSFSFDRRLYGEDVDASLAWARALGRARVLTESEVEALVAGLEEVRGTLADPAFEPLPTDEDIHTAVERLLTEQVGPVAGKLHTGRSRNDQVATDFRLWVMRACDRIEVAILDLARAMAQSARAGVDLPMPGYTHMRPAQPVTWGHWMLSAFWPLIRSRDRFALARASASVLPLGSAALAGTAYPIDRQAIADDLGFDSVSPNSIDAISDRDFAVEYLFAAAMLGVNLSRHAEGLILYSGPEYGFVELDEGYTSGSSLMPQKRNPGALELTRAKAGRLVGHLTGLLTTLKGLPSAYDNDLQEDKPPVFDAHDTLLEVLPVLTGLIGTLQLHPSRMAAAITPDMLSTDLADYLVGKGLPFREAHAVAGRVVRVADEKQVALDQVPLRELRVLDGRFEQDVVEVFDVEAALERRSSLGGTAPSAVRDQLKAAEEILSRR
ncbi:MAG: argininosuccinate lyase [Chloroflexi bacterium]|nr:argininosuccinate lyase [Chloroflexota bacterium]MCI0892237.1 argininosuccinate lyase [Chloroflexota bacterium]